MPRFFVDENKIIDAKIEITDQDALHISNVLRKKTGDRLVVCDGNYTDYFCEIAEIGKKTVVLNILEHKKSESEPEVKVTLFQGIAKSDKLETVVQKNVEIGIFEIVPFQSKFSVAKPDRFSKKLERLAKISEAAAKQSGRGIIPRVHDCIELKNINFSDFDAVFVCYENENPENSAKKVLSDFDFKKTAVIIGPEGGFDTDEVEFLKKNGAVTLSLGKRILRTETAGMVFLSLLLYEAGDF